MTLTCPKCGKQIDSASVNVAQDMAFCAPCGEMHKISVLTAAAVQAKPQFCPKCGAQLDAGTQFCTACGSSQHKNAVVNDIRAGHHEKLDIGALSMNEIPLQHQSVSQPLQAQAYPTPPASQKKKKTKRIVLIAVGAVVGILLIFVVLPARLRDIATMSEDNDKAIRYFNIALHFPFWNSDGYISDHLGKRYLLNEQYSNAIVHFSTAIKLNRSGNLVKSYRYSDRGTAYMLMGQKEQAIQDFETAITLYNANWFAINTLQELLEN